MIIIKDKFDKKIGKSTVSISCEGKIFTGKAKCHQEDRPFISELVGKNIAFYRAEIKALTYLYEKAKNEAKIKNLMIKQVNNFSKTLNPYLDPSNKFFKNAQAADRKKEYLRRKLKDKKAQLNKYLQSQKKLVTLINNLRLSRLDKDK